MSDMLPLRTSPSTIHDQHQNRHNFGRATRCRTKSAAMKSLDSRRILKALRNASSASRNAACPSCGLALVYVDASLSLYGSDESVTITLGFCEHCDGLTLQPSIQ